MYTPIELIETVLDALAAVWEPCFSAPRSDYEHLERGADGCPAEGAQRVSGLLQLLRTRLTHALVATGCDDVVLGRVQAQHALTIWCCYVTPLGDK